MTEETDVRWLDIVAWKEISNIVTQKCQQSPFVEGYDCPGMARDDDDFKKHQDF